MYTNYCMTITNCKQNGMIFGSFVHILQDVYSPGSGAAYSLWKQKIPP